MVEQRSPKPRVVSSSLATPATGLGFLLKKKPQQRKFSFKIELEVNSNYYRANKITLYAKEKGMSDLEPGPGEILGSIGESRQMETRIPAEETGALLPAWHEARVTEERDLVTFEAKFEAGTLAMLLLESEEDSRQYFISTSRGRRGAMWTGTFLPDDDRDTRTIISKEGLKGEYAVRVIVEDLLYETGITIQA